MTKYLRALLAVWLVALLASSGDIRAAEITVLSDTLLAPALRTLGEAFRKERGHQAKFVFGFAIVEFIDENGGGAGVNEAKLLA